MNEKDISTNPFSLIADFEGDIAQLFATPFDEILPVLPLRNLMLFPGVVAPVTVGRESSLRLIEQVERKGTVIAVACQRDASVETPHVKDLYPVAVVAKVMRVIELPNGNKSAILQSFGRIQLGEETRQKPFLRAHVERLEDILPTKDDKEYQALADACKDTTIRFIHASETYPDEAAFALRNISHPVFLLNFICTNLPFSLDEKAKLIQEDDQCQRGYKLLSILNRELQFATLKQNIQDQTREELDKQQRDYFLQQQIKNIQSELGDGQNEDVIELTQKASKIKLPEKAREIFDKEMKKLQRIPPQSPDYNVELNYAQTLVSLPWGEKTTDNLNIKNAEKVLNQNHYGMEKVKERILEYLAVLKFRKDMKAPILCLYGPPGVGKTSLGKSIANALRRKYVRISLGGVHDEAEIRGHRRTYVGAMPGRIIKSVQKAGTDNPVFILDEIDKVSDRNFNGDPQSALLEVLDPEQNKAFHDNYLDMDYDLSNILFIATANSLQTIPAPLLDRMEIIEVEGYLTEEKIQIAKRHLIPRIEQALNIDATSQLKVKFKSKALEFLIENYTRESGVRQLEKQLDKVYRKMAYLSEIETSDKSTFSDITPTDIETLLGKPLFNRDKYQGNAYAGVVTGLAWTSVGGEILFIETSVSRSKSPKLTLTGNLGDVMKESAVLALEYVKAHAEKLNLDYRVFEHWSIHVHVPEGATPKDGPSAGITIATSIASALTQRKVRPNTAMTGEITLRGRVLPVGGIKEKILAAKRAGIKDIIMSEENMKDIEEINQKYVEGLQFHFVKNVAEVFDIALLKEQVDNAICLDTKD